jgi:hypothetical protein
VPRRRRARERALARSIRALSRAALQRLPHGAPQPLPRRWLAHGEGYPDWTLRLFHRAYASWSNDEVHEAVLTTAEVGRLDGDLLHDSAEDSRPTSRSRTATRRCTRGALQAGRARELLAALASPLARFVKFYLLRLGFLDGGPGFAHIVIGCNSTFLKYLKLIELQRRADGEARGTANDDPGHRRRRLHRLELRARLARGRASRS